MRNAIIAGNWKMNKTPEEAKALVEALAPLVKDANAQVVVCPPFVCLTAAQEAAKGTNVKSVHRTVTIGIQVHSLAK